jgi:hypothetical protein
VEEFFGGEGHHCQETTLGEPGPEIPTSDSPEVAPAQFQESEERPTPPELEPEQSTSPNSLSSKARSASLDTIRRGTLRRVKSISRSLEQFRVPSNRQNTSSRRALPALEHLRHRRPSSRRPLPAIPEEEPKPEEESHREEEVEPDSEPITIKSSPQRVPTPPLTPWRRLVLIQDYTDRDENLRSTIDRLDDAIAATPQLWIPGFSEQLDGQPVPTLQFYRELHEFHQQRIANRAPSSIPYFFPRLGANQHEW